ncbi:hypothetical protein SAMN04488524_2215 [Pedobacter africanus]|uniref:Uncharacterized protein n=1 Tax=Pedobacter africanus TaxID=151894 RepID=A0A1W2BC88_9SPHI|nr:hypothetical protein SAMN04488524_2215 [Pedobacter africanus]
MNKIVNASEVLLDYKSLLARLDQIDKQIAKQNEKLDLIIRRLSNYLENRDNLKQYEQSRTIN